MPKERMLTEVYFIGSCVLPPLPFASETVRTGYIKCKYRGDCNDIQHNFFFDILLTMHLSN